MGLARKEFQPSLSLRLEKWDKPSEKLFFVSALSVSGAWDGAAARPFMSYSPAGSLNTYHSKSLSLNELLSEMYQNFLFAPQRECK